MNATDSAGKLSGVFAPITSPFSEDESLDTAGLISNMGRYSQTGLRGYLALGSNGENRSLTEDERLTLLELVVRHKHAEQVVLAGAAYTAQRATERFLAAAADLGADFGLVLPPDYFRKQMTDDVLFSYYSALADTSPIPLLLYNAPQFCGVAISPELAERLSGHPRIVGIKYSASTGIEDLLPLERAEFHVLPGSANFLFPAMMGGALGGTVSFADYLPDLAVELCRLGTDRDAQRGWALQEKVARINKAVSGTLGVAGVKGAMDLVGLVGGHPRRPLLPLTATDVAELREVLAAEEVLP